MTAQTTVGELEAELAGTERAIRHLIGETAALSSDIRREEALAALLNAKRLTTRAHPVIARPQHDDRIPHGDRFFDVSSIEPNVEWSIVKAAGGQVRVGRLGMVKVSEGGGWTDPLGALRWRTMTSLGFAHRGAYHFLHPSVSPREQASHMLEQLGGREPTRADVLVCDAEVTDGETARTVRLAVAEFGAELRKHTPAALWLYGGGPFAADNELELAPYDAHWLAAYVGDPAPFMHFGRNRTVAWQYSDGTHGPIPHGCPGIGPCDMSIVL